MRLVTVSLAHSECSTMAIYLPVGSRHDPIGKAGLAHFMEHMAFKGTARRSAYQISLDLEHCGSQSNAFTCEEYTFYEARGDASSLPIITDVLCDMVWHSSLSPRDISLERNVIKEEIIMYEESPSDHIGDLISQALWSPDPLGEPITGTHTTLKNITRSDLFDFFKLNHFRDDVIIAMAGPQSPQEMSNMLMPHLPHEVIDSPRQVPTFKRTASSRPVVKNRATDQLQLSIAYHTPGRTHDWKHALRLLSLIIGETSSSRLFYHLREELGLSYNISSDVVQFHDTGCFEISAGMDVNQRNKALEIIAKDLEEMVHFGPSEAELERAKNIALTQHKLAMESTAAHMSWAAESLLFDNVIISPQKSREKLMSQTCDDLKFIAHQVFQSKNQAYAEIRPKKTY